jgi:hypothetical protein
MALGAQRYLRPAIIGLGIGSMLAFAVTHQCFTEPGLSISWFSPGNCGACWRSRLWPASLLHAVTLFRIRRVGGSSKLDRIRGLAG